MSIGITHPEHSRALRLPDQEIYELCIMFPGLTPRDVRAMDLEDRNGLRATKIALDLAQPELARQAQKKAEEIERRKGSMKGLK